LAPHIVFIKGTENKKNIGLNPDNNMGYAHENQLGWEE
jgi:hypothetical protein